MYIFRQYSKMTSLSPKKPPFEKTTSSNEKTQVFLGKSRLKRYFELLTRIIGYPLEEICKFFDY